MKDNPTPNGSNDPFALSGSSPPTVVEVVWMTAKEAAQYLRCAVKTIYNYKCNGQLRGYNLGGRRKGVLRFKKADLDAFVLGKRVA